MAGLGDHINIIDEHNLLAGGNQNPLVVGGDDDGVAAPQPNGPVATRPGKYRTIA
jgi:hypothetical protein